MYGKKQLYYKLELCVLQARLTVGHSLIIAGDYYSPPLYYPVQQEFGGLPDVSNTSAHEWIIVITYCIYYRVQLKEPGGAWLIFILKLSWSFYLKNQI